MLVVCNGSMKSGSTWLMEIVAAHGRWQPVPDEYRNQRWHNPSVDLDAVDRFFADKIYREQDVYCKQHWEKEQKYRDLLLDPDIKMINIVRDIRDVLVSRYFHDQRTGLVTADNIEDYYFADKGRIRLRKYMTYHVFWHGSGEGPEPYLCHYERLHSDFNDEAGGLFRYLGSPLTEEELNCISEKTAFENIPASGEGRFFRKGKAGDWINYVNDRMIEDIARLAEEFSYPHALFVDAAADG